MQFDGDGGGGAGDGPGEAADDGPAAMACSSLFVAQAGVEVVRRPAPASCASSRGTAAGRAQVRRSAAWARGSMRWRAASRNLVAGRGRAASLLPRPRSPSARRGSARRSFGWPMAGSASRQARLRSGAATALSASWTAHGLLAGRVIDDLGIGLDAGDVIADLVDPILLAYLRGSPPATGSARPGSAPGRMKIRRQVLQHDLAASTKLAGGFAVVLELDGVFFPRRLRRRRRRRWS